MLGFILFWNGAGILVPVIAFGVMISINVLVDFIYGDGFYRDNQWPKSLGLAIAALLIWEVGRWLNGKGFFFKKVESKEYESIPKRDALGSTHDLYWIPFEWWAALPLIVGIVMYFGDRMN